MDPTTTVEPRVPSEWEELRGYLRHQSVEVLRLIAILVQDAVILLAGFIAEFAYEHWLHSSHPFFQLALNLSSALFLLLYGITVTVHVVQYVRGQFGATPATMLGQYLPWTLAAGGVIAAAVGVTVPRLGSEATESRPDRLPTRFEIATPPTSDPASFALSPDGRQLAFVATTEGASRLWVRPIDQVTAQPLRDTEGASFPFWAPDGKAIGFFADGKLKRIDLGGGAAQVLAVTPSGRSVGRGGTWNRGGVIVFAPAPQAHLMRVAATGGMPVAVTRGTTSLTSRWPQFLPDGRRFLFTVAGAGPETGGVYVGAIDGVEPTRVLPDTTSAVFVPPGYLLLVRQGALVALRFDATRGVVSGDPMPVAQGVGSDLSLGRGLFTASATGTLAHRAIAGGRRQLVWIDRAGTVQGTIGPADDENNLNYPELSPDGRRVAVNRNVQGNVDVWLIDIGRGLPSRFTFEASNDAAPLWSPDGRRVVFRSLRKGAYDLFEKPANGADEEQPLLVTPESKGPQSLSPDGRFLLYTTQSPKTGLDLWALPMIGALRPAQGGPSDESRAERKPFPVVQTSFDESGGQFSPDGRWVAYQSNASGQTEIYVRPFPGPGGTWQVSTTGGSQPRWRPDGKELFYVAPDARLMAAPIAVAADRQTLEAGAPVPLFLTRLAPPANVLKAQQYTVAPDGRFLMNVIGEGATSAAPITVVLNWEAGLRK